MRDYTKALSSLYPGVEWSLLGDDIEWVPGENGIEVPGANLIWQKGVALPTREEVEAEVDRLESEYNTTQYQRLRAPEYPPLADLADALYHQSKGDDTKMISYLAACEAVKLKYPKGE